MQPCKLPAEIVTYNLAMKLFAKLGDRERVQQIWQEALGKYRMDATMAAARLVAAADDANTNAAITMLEEMAQARVQADVGHCTSVLRACETARQGGAEAAKLVFKRMLSAGLTPDLRLFTIMVQTLEGEPVEDLQGLFKEMQERRVKHDHIFTDKYLKAVLSMGKVRKVPMNKLAGRLSQVSAARKKAAAAALSHFKSEGDLSSFAQSVEMVLEQQGVEV